MNLCDPCRATSHGQLDAFIGRLAHVVAVGTLNALSGAGSSALCALVCRVRAFPASSACSLIEVCAVLTVIPRSTVPFAYLTFALGHSDAIFTKVVGWTHWTRLASSFTAPATTIKVLAHFTRLTVALNNLSTVICGVIVVDAGSSENVSNPFFTMPMRSTTTLVGTIVVTIFAWASIVSSAASSGACSLTGAARVRTAPRVCFIGLMGPGGE